MITDFRLKVFETVARRLSFTKAAGELFITQPAVTRHIREMETQLDCQLFRRNGRNITLTPAGILLMDHARKILRAYEALNETMVDEAGEALAGELVIGASTTAAQYVLPPVLALFNRQYPGIIVKLINGNSDEIEQAVVDETVHLGVVEGTAHHPDLHYHPFLKDEIALIGGSSLPAGNREGLPMARLAELPLVMREEGSGTRRVVEQALKKKGIKPAGLHVLMQLGNTESIKLYLRHSHAYSFLSLLAVREELDRGVLNVLPVRDLVITRFFRFASAHGDRRKLAELFMRTCMSYHNEK